MSKNGHEGEATLRRPPLYERLAEELAASVAAGTFRPGERLPSVRRLSQEQNLSVTTVLAAYRLLEDRGVIRARPQSGYFVSYLPVPTGLCMSSPPSDPAAVSVSDLHVMIMRNACDPSLTQFGAAIPDPELLPTERLYRILASILRRRGVPARLCVAPEGWEELRVQVAQRLYAEGCALSPDELIITSGCTEAISLALLTLTRPGDLVAVESPAYFGVLQILESLGLRALEIPTCPQAGLSVDALRFALDHHPVKACVVSSNFSNPLGSLMPDSAKMNLVQLLTEKQIPLIEDDLYGNLYLQGSRPSVARSYDQEGLVLLCSSYNKDVAPEYRVGWLACGRFASQVRRMKMATVLCTPALNQVVLAEFLRTGGYEHHLARMRRAYAQRVHHMREAALDWFPAGTKVTAPAGGYLLWVELPEQIDALVLYKRSLKIGVSLVPGHLFSATKQFNHCIRLNAAYWSEKTAPALLRLAELTHQMLGERQSRTAAARRIPA